MNKIKDYFSFKLVFFTFFLTFIFLYLVRVEGSKKNYNTYISYVDELIVSNLKLNNYLNQKEKFINYDDIVKEVRTMEHSIEMILTKEIQKEFGVETYNTISDIENLFLQKKDFVERFKSKHASTLNSVHFIYDLNQYLLKDNFLNEDTKLIINSTLFMIMQQFVNINKNEKAIVSNLKQLRILNKRFHSSRLTLMINHVNNILINVKLVEKIKNDSRGLKLDEKLSFLNDLLVKKYNKKLFSQLLISIFFFIIIVVFIFLIYNEHRKSQKIKKELAAFKYAVENSDNSIILTDKEKNILYVNDIFEKTSGYKKSEAFGSKPEILKSGETPEESYKDLNKQLDLGEKWEGEFINKKKDGSLYYEKASIVPIVLDNEITNYLAIKLDITKYIMQNENLKLSAAVFDNVQEGIVVIEATSREIISTNKAFEDMSGYSTKELKGETLDLLKSEEHDKIFYDKLIDTIYSKGSWRGKIISRKKNGDLIPLWTNISTIHDNKGDLSKIIVVSTNLEEIIETQKKADFLAYHDSLTKLPNRAKLENDLEFSLKVAKRKNQNLFVLFIDLDRFKMINDSLGHAIGDELLKIISIRIKDVLRGSDIVARMGGDEFIVILDSTRDKNAAGYVCKKILDEIKKTITIEKNILNTSASIGVAIFPDDGEDITTLIKNADTAMYHAKNLGKDNYQYYNKQLSLNVHEQLKIEQALKDSIINNELYLNYQPQYDLETKEIIAFEALVRWQNKDLGFVPPSKFIPIAEDNGLILEIGKFIIDAACRDFMEMKKVKNSLKYIAINVSSVQFKEKNFVEKVLNIVTKHGLLPSQVEIEVTERYIMEYSETNLNTLQEFQDLGFRFSIDDFGTGYSSMSYLTKFPINVIKVDKAFVDNTPQDNNNVQITKAIVALSKSLNYKVVAEGIEHLEQEEFLKSIKCDIGQGYFFSKPLSFDDAIKALKK